MGSIHVAMLPFCQDMKTTALQLHKHEYSWVAKNKKPYGHWPVNWAWGVLWPSYCLLCGSYIIDTSFSPHALTPFKPLKSGLLLYV